MQSSRNRISVHHPHLWKGEPFRELTFAKRKTGGRDHTGQIVVRHIGGGHKQRIRNVDFYRFVPGIHDVIRLEYDPGRSGHIALLKRRDARSATERTEEEKIANHIATSGRDDLFPVDAKESVMSGWSYILAPDGLRAGDTVRSFRMGIPQDYVEGWYDVRKSNVVTAAEKDAESRGSLVVVNDDPSSPQTVNPPIEAAARERAGVDRLTPRALALLRTETLRPGNVLPLYLIPPGTQVHNLSLKPMAKMRLVRSAGTSAEVMGHQDLKGEPIGGLDVLYLGGHMRADGSSTKPRGWTVVKMSSGEIRKIAPGGCATIGKVSK